MPAPDQQRKPNTAANAANRLPTPPANRYALRRRGSAQRLARKHRDHAKDRPLA